MVVEVFEGLDVGGGWVFPGLIHGLAGDRGLSAE